MIDATIFKNAFDDAVQNIKQSEKEEQKKNSNVSALTENLKKIELEPKKPEETGPDSVKTEEK